jgi:hypothetical protein
MLVPAHFSWAKGAGDASQLLVGGTFERLSRPLFLDPRWQDIPTSPARLIGAGFSFLPDRAMLA